MGRLGVCLFMVRYTMTLAALVAALVVLSTVVVVGARLLRQAATPTSPENDRRQKSARLMRDVGMGACAASHMPHE